MSDLQVGVFLNKEILKQGTGEPLDSVEMHQVCGQSNQFNKLKEEIAQLKADKAELVESFDELLYWASMEMDKNGQVIECEEGAGKFVSSGALNGVVSRLKRAIKDEEYMDFLLQKHKG